MKIIRVFLIAVFLLSCITATFAKKVNDNWDSQIVDKFKMGGKAQFYQYEPYYINAVDDETLNRRSNRVRQRNLEVQAAEQVLMPQQVRPVRELVDSSTDYAIYQSEYSVNIDEDLATVNGRIQLEVFGKGKYVKIPLVSSNVGLKDASLNRKPTFITRRRGKYCVLVNKPGRYLLEVEFFVKVKRERENGPGSLLLDVVSSPISILKIQLEQGNYDIFADPSIKVESKKEKERTRAVAILPYTEQVRIRWSPTLVREEVGEVKLEPKLYAETATLISLGEGVAKCTSQIQYSILQSEVAHLVLSLPEDVGVIEVKGKDIRNWKVNKKDKIQDLDVYLSYGVKGPYRLTVVYEKTIGAGSVTAQIPELKVVGVEREKGYIGIEAQTNIEITEGVKKGVSPVDIKELPRIIWRRAKNPLLMGYKYLEHPFSITLDVTKHKEVPVLVAIVDNAGYTCLYTRDGKILSRALYWVRNNVKQFLKVTLPDSAELWSCAIDGAPVKPAKDSQGNILIPLKKSQNEADSLSQFSVEVVYLLPASKINRFGRVGMVMPKIDLPQNVLWVNMYMPKNKSYFKFKGDLEFQKSPDFGIFNLYVKRSMQAKKKYVQRSTNLSQVAGDYAELESVARVPGVLPVKIEIPKEGKLLQFRKFLVTDELPKLSFWYGPQIVAPWLKKVFFFFFGALIAVGIFFLAAKTLGLFGRALKSLWAAIIGLFKKK